MEKNVFPQKWIFNSLAIFTILALFAIAASAEQSEYPDLAGEANSINFSDFSAFAVNWQKNGSDLKGDFDDSGRVDINDLAYLSYYWLTLHWECENIDIDYSGRVDFADFVLLADCWISHNGDTNYEADCDFDGSNIVDIYDLKAFCNCWLKGSTPEDVFELFKTALAEGDVNKAVGYFAEFVADDYRIIFNENVDKLQSLAADIGVLSFECRDKDIAVYELSNAGGTNFFPVIFTMDDESKWKIAVF